ncbi:hypothetical protein [Tropicimonas aquimaris]|uniref:DUF1344 domain-containing protein n=1 Tax=Tropicimonas aquimaris TaxID=914152 RepID=A0ABW3INZ8_9RHOB
MRLLLASALATLSVLPAAADETEGLILAYDRVASILVLEDLTVWPLAANLAVPEDLQAGDRVSIDFRSDGENGVAAVNALTRTATAQ